MPRPLDSRNPMEAPPGVQCTARGKRSGDRCKRPAMLGANVCRSHGGASPQARAAAKRRLEEAAAVLVQRLLNLALDGDAPDSVALQAINSALNRAGMSAKHSDQLDVAAQPWQQVASCGESVDGLSSLGEFAFRQAGIPAFNFAVEHDPPLITHTLVGGWASGSGLLGADAL